MTHRMTVQYEAKLTFDLSLPANDAALVRDQTQICVVVEPAEPGDSCSKFTLKIRIGEDRAAVDYVQANFVHRSAATGAASCLLQYLRSKRQLNVSPDIVGHAATSGRETHGNSFVPIGWKMDKSERGHTTASHAEHHALR